MPGGLLPAVRWHAFLTRASPFLGVLVCLRMYMERLTLGNGQQHTEESLC